MVKKVANLNHRFNCLWKHGLAADVSTAGMLFDGMMRKTCKS